MGSNLRMSIEISEFLLLRNPSRKTAKLLGYLFGYEVKQKDPTIAGLDT